MTIFIIKSRLIPAPAIELLQQRSFRTNPKIRPRVRTVELNFVKVQRTSNNSSSYL